MHKFVLKIGGSNLKNKESLSEIISLAKAYQQPVIIVVSAFYGVTDRLDTLISEDAKEQLNTLKQIHISILKKYISSQDAFSESVQLIENSLATINNLLKDKSISDTIRHNKILSYGEKMSAGVIHAVLNENGFPNQLALPEEIGLFSNRRFFQGSILLKKSSANLKKHLQDNVSYIIPGFYAQSEQGETILLGRGGSDYSAACIAHCVDAEYLDVWKDVEGYLSADPKLIAGTKKIARLHYLEAAELSYFGAKILHPRTIQPLVSKDIQVRLFNPAKHKKPANESTRINSQSVVSKEIIKSITYNPDISLLKLKGSGVGIKKGILAEVTTAFDQAQLNIRSVVTSQTAIHFILSRSNLAQAEQIVRNVNKTKDFEIEIEDNIAWIAAIGNGIIQKEGLAAQILSALAKAKINVRQIVLGASEVAIYIVVERKVVKHAIHFIHQEIFNQSIH
jgi:aspartokinase/homoserine dehydrogenase 1